MNRNKISKLVHISTIDNKQETAAESVLSTHLYGEKNLVLDYLVNYQNINPIRIYSGMEYVQHYTNDDESEEIKDFKCLVVENSKKEKLKELELLLATRRSCRKFSSKIDKSDLFALLDCTLKECVNPDGNCRRNYPSGGALYPIKILVYISGVNNIEDGVYLYNHRKNSLIYYESDFDDSCVDQILVGQKIKFSNSKIIVMYIYDFLQNYIKYHDIALSLAFIEVGAISQTLQLIAPKCNIGYCDIGGFPKGKMERWLNLNKEYFHVIHVGVMGGIGNEV